MRECNRLCVLTNTSKYFLNIGRQEGNFVHALEIGHCKVSYFASYIPKELHEALCELFKAHLRLWLASGKMKAAAEVQTNGTIKGEHHGFLILTCIVVEGLNR